MKKNNRSFHELYDLIKFENNEDNLYININLDIFYLFSLYYPEGVVIEDYIYLFREFKYNSVSSLSITPIPISEEDYQVFIYILELYYKYKEDTFKMILSNKDTNIYFNLYDLMKTEEYKEYTEEIDFPNYILGLIAIKEYTSND